MLALCWPEAMLQAESKRSVASLGKSGSVAPALQRVKAPSRSLSWGNFPDNIGLVRQCWRWGTGSLPARGTLERDTRLPNCKLQ